MQNLFVAAVALALMSASAQAQTSTPFAAAVGANAPLPTPFASNNGQIPPNYSHPLFALSHDYPSTLAPPPPEPPWRQAIGDGQITVQNAGAYVAALKEYVSQAKMTLGWQGRLSGPNDGALNDAVLEDPVPKVAPNLPSSSCMSCHSVAEWPMKSFLLPTSSDPQQFGPTGFVNSDYLIMWPPGSTGETKNGSPFWMHWFQSRPGAEPADAGTVAFDYDMVFTFKSLMAWQSVQPVAPAALGLAARRLLPVMSYNGRPFGG